jgi:hypothetical protein
MNQGGTERRHCLSMKTCLEKKTPNSIRYKFKKKLNYNIEFTNFSSRIPLTSEDTPANMEFLSSSREQFPFFR